MVNTSAPTAAPKDVEMWTIRGLVARHKLAAVVAAAVVAVLLAMILVAVFGSTGGPVTDATSCSQWGSSNQDQQAAYARLYLREHGPLRDGASSPASVIAAINKGCTQAYGEDVSDTTNVMQAISGHY